MITNVWTGIQAVGVLRMRNRDAQRAGQCSDLVEAQLTRPGVAYCGAGKVKTADKLHLVVDSIRLDTQRCRVPTAPPAADGAGGSPLR